MGSGPKWYPGAFDQFAFSREAFDRGANAIFAGKRALPQLQA
jgi:hypothetical protein